MGDERGQAQSQRQSVNNKQQFTFNIASNGALSTRPGGARDPAFRWGRGNSPPSK